MNRKTINYSHLGPGRKDGMKYMNLEPYACKVPILGCMVFIPKGRLSDGATSARDLGAPERGWRRHWAKVVGWMMRSPREKITDAWFVHDEICLTGCVGHDKKVSNFYASTVLSLLLWRDGYKVEAFTWFLPTFLHGGGKCRENGFFFVNDK